MTGQELVKKFRELSQDEVTPYLWEDAFVLDSLNEAEREATDRARLLYDDSQAMSVEVLAGQSRCAINPLIIDIERAAFKFKHDAGDIMQARRLKLFDRLELDRRRPRSTYDPPFGLVYDGSQEVEIVPFPHRDGTLLLGAYRWPLADFNMDTEPEISKVHHLALVDWALFRAFSIPDADEADERLAAYYSDRFDRFFGKRVDARKRRMQRANKPHINKLW